VIRELQGAYWWLKENTGATGAKENTGDTGLQEPLVLNGRYPVIRELQEPGCYGALVLRRYR